MLFGTESAELLRTLPKVIRISMSNNNWLIKKIPKEYRDKDFLVEVVLLECLKHYVSEEGEDCFKRIDFEVEIKTENAEFVKSLKKYYHWLTEERSNLEQKIIELSRLIEVKILDSTDGSLNFEKISYSARPYEDVNQEINQLEEEIQRNVDEICLWVVKNKGSLWT